MTKYLWMAAVWLGMGIATAQGSLITFDFSGPDYERHGPEGYLTGLIAVGNSFSGNMTFRFRGTRCFYAPTLDLADICVRQCELDRHDGQCDVRLHGKGSP